MATVNKVFLLGNLTRDPELKEISPGTTVCDLGIAVNEDYTNKKGEKIESVSYFDVAVWNKAGEACNKFLEKGRLVHVEGRLKQDRWENDQGEGRSRVRVVANSVQFLPKPGKQDDN